MNYFYLRPNEKITGYSIGFYRKTKSKQSRWVKVFRKGDV